MTWNIGSSRLAKHAAGLLIGLALGVPLLAGDEIFLKGPPEPQVVSPLLAVEIPEQLEVYSKAVGELARISARFLDQYQRFIRTVDEQRRAGRSLGGEGQCLSAQLTTPFLGAREAWERYHTQARKVRNLHRRLEAFQSAGYAAGLTPDLQDRLRRAIDGYQRVRQEHIDLQSILRHQMEGEVRKAGCDPAGLSVPAAPGAVASVAPAPEGDAAKPAPAGPPTKKTAAAPAGRPAPVAPAAPLVNLDDDLDDPEGEAGAAPAPASDSLQAEEVVTSDALVPQEETTPEAGRPPPLTDGPASTPPASPEEKSDDPAPPAAPTPPAGSRPESGPAPSPEEIPPDLQVKFTVDNAQCDRSFVVYLDGRRLGVVQGKQSVTFISTEGGHTLCLAREGDPDACAAPGAKRKVTLYEGFAIRPRC